MQTTADLAEADKKRREEFKEYEMQKEFEKQEQLKALDEEHRKEMEKQIEEKEKKHKEHEPVSSQQFVYFIHVKFCSQL